MDAAARAHVCSQKQLESGAGRAMLKIGQESESWRLIPHDSGLPPDEAAADEVHIITASSPEPWQMSGMTCCFPAARREA